MAELLSNRKAARDFEILEKIEAGIELLGFEVKAVRAGRGSLAGSFISIQNGQAFLEKAHIAPIQPKNAPDEFDTYRPRRLLLAKNEARRLESKLNEPGLTIIPLSLYNKSGLIKVSVALARGKKKADKREDIKRRDEKRILERELKQKLRF